MDSFAVLTPLSVKVLEPEFRPLRIDKSASYERVVKESWQRVRHAGALIPDEK
jgi:hypothetical protein